MFTSLGRKLVPSGHACSLSMKPPVTDSIIFSQSGYGYEVCILM